MKYKFAVIGDIHMGILDHRIPRFAHKQYDILYSILYDIKQAGFEQVVLLGDVFDSENPSPEIVKSLIGTFNMWRKTLKFHWIAGNHDTLSKETNWFRVLQMLAGKNIKNLRMYSEPTEMPGRIGLLPYPHTKPMGLLNFGHAERPGATWPNGQKVKTEGEWNEDVYYIMGHLHTKHSVGRTLYTGSCMQVSFDEQPEKWWHGVLWDDVSHKLTVKAYPVDMDRITKWRLRTEYVTSIEQLDKALDHEPHEYVKVVLDRSVDLPKGFKASGNLTIVNAPRVKADATITADTNAHNEILGDWDQPEFHIGRMRTHLQDMGVADMDEAALMEIFEKALRGLKND